jgi:hypothetical protein
MYRVLCIIQQWVVAFPDDIAPLQEKVDYFFKVLAPQSGFNVGEIGTFPFSSPLLISL